MFRSIEIFLTNRPCCCCCCCHCLVIKLSPILWDLMNFSPACSSIQRISQVRILERVAICFSRGSSQPRGWSHFSCIGRRMFYHWVTRKAQQVLLISRKEQILWGLRHLLPSSPHSKENKLNYWYIQTHILFFCFSVNKIPLGPLQYNLTITIHVQQNVHATVLSWID